MDKIDENTQKKHIEFTKLCPQVEWADGLKDTGHLISSESTKNVTIRNPMIDKLAEIDHLEKVILQ